MLVEYYYDWTWEPGEGGQYTSDTEGNLVLLCTDCARKAGAQVQWAGAGDDDSRCELCERDQGGERDSIADFEYEYEL